MNNLSNFMPEQVLTIIRKIKSIIRIILTLVIVCLLISSMLICFWSDNIRGAFLDASISPFPLYFVWYSIIGGIWAAFLSTIILVIAAFIYKAKHIQIWSAFKREVFLVLGIIGSLFVLYLCNWAIN